MQYKVLSASLGLDGKVYPNGGYIESKSEKKMRELISSRCIVLDEEVTEGSDIKESIVEETKVPHNADVRTISNPSGTKKGGRKRK